ncbi:MAG: ABC transporter ATP-binding protein/permease [Verrucomicrobia bacterium]|nr:ABC transporter ATP-binding protein/permease [Verrucomicrobiota bacterium]
MNAALSRLIAILLSDRKLALKAAFLQVMQAVTFIPFTAAVGWFVDEVILAERGWEWVLIYLLANLLWWPVHMYFTVRAFACTQMMVRTTVARLRRLAVDKLQSLSVSFFTRQGAGALSNKVTVDITRVEGFLNNVTNNLLVGISVGLGTMVYLIYLNAYLAVLSLVLVPLQILVVRLMHKRLKTLNKRVQVAGENFSEKMVEFVAGMRLTKSFGNEEMVASRIAHTIENLRSSGFDASIATRWMLMWLQMAGQYMPVLVWGMGALMYWRGLVTMGELVAFIGLLTFIQGGINACINALEQWLPAKPGLEAVLEILDSDELDGFNGNQSPVTLRGNIECREVTFYYPDTEEPVLRNINLSIPSGQKVGLVGETGAGKSTFLDLIMGFYKPQQGRITWDGLELDQIGCLNLRRNVAIMGQEAFIWNDSIRENIRFGRAQASDTEVEEAARKAQADSFIRKLERGYATNCGERGGKLSGGSANGFLWPGYFLRNPAFVILDEPTSALDAETEAKLQKDLDAMCEGRTTFIVAHRLVTLQSVDRILVFHQGRIVEDGAPKELLAKPGGHYRHLYELQHRALD